MASPSKLVPWQVRQPTDQGFNGESRPALANTVGMRTRLDRCREVEPGLADADAGLGAAFRGWHRPSQADAGAILEAQVPGRGVASAAQDRCEENAVPRQDSRVLESAG